MMERHLTEAVAGLGNHLWQSTLIAVAAGLLTLAFRKHHAAARFWLWLAASLKFLVPFSLLVTIGNRLAGLRAPAAATPISFTIEEIAQPFTQAAARATPTASPVPALPAQSHLLVVVTVIWMCGFVAVLLLWLIRWRRIAAAMKGSVGLSEGREISLLRRIERQGGVNPIAVLLSQDLLEPGIFGIARPVLIWPEGISRRLEDAQLEAVLAHEVCHVRRRDNLSAALHMFVEAGFWFYPLVWWLGARLTEERERACDEQVVASGSDRQVYAESILKVCEFCLGSPLPCVSGVTGADLKKRMVHIMNDRILHKLGFARKLLLTAAAALAIAIPVTFGLFDATPTRAQSQNNNATLQAPVYSSVSIKLAETDANQPIHTQMMFNLMDGSFVARGVTLQRLIQLAYRVQDSQISGGPDWLNSAKFNVDAKLDPSYVSAMHQQMSDHKDPNDQGLLKAILTDKFKLATHSELRTAAAYDLVADENGVKLQAAGNEMRTMRLGPGELTSSGASLDLLAAQLSARLGRPVVDKTDLKGNYAFNLHWTPDPSENERLKSADEPVFREPLPDPNGPSLFTALQEQLGLKLVPNTERVPVLVIDHAEQPSEN